MRSALVTAVALFWCGCATPAPRSEERSPLASLILAQSAPPTISWTEIERAKALLAEAKEELQPLQYQLLEKDLIQAETDFQRFSELAKARGEAAQVVRGAEALVGAQQIAEEVGALSTAGPLLVALALVWPSSTATESEERPPAFVARINLEASLQKVAADSRQVAEALKAAAPKKSDQPAKGTKGSDKCGSCVCYYRGFGPDAAGPRATRAACKEYCESDEHGHRPANGMKCTGDKAVEWWN